MTQKNTMFNYFVKCELNEGNDSDEEVERGRKRPRKRRKYNTSYIEYGFISQCDGDIEKPFCLLCGQVLVNDSMKPSNLKKHLEVMHKEFVGKPKSYFETLRDSLNILEEGPQGQLQAYQESLRNLNVAEAVEETAEESLPPPIKLGETPVRKVRTAVLRRYNSAFIKFGFVSNCDEGIEKPQCIVCGKILSNESLKPSNLKRHLKTLHGELVGKPEEYFQSLTETVNVKELEKEHEKVVTVVRPNEAAVVASYKVSFHIAKARMPFIIAEELVLPCIKDICAELFDEAAVAEINTVSLSKETVTRRVKELADDIEEQVLENLKTSKYFSLYIDEALDLTSKTILLVYTRYEDHGDLKEEMLCSIEVSSQTSENHVEVFDTLNEYLTTHGLSWANCVGVCTDGAASLTGSHSEFVVRIRRTLPNCRVIHSLIRHELLISSDISSDLSNVLNEAVRIINYIKVNASSSRFFQLLCDNMEHVDKEYLLNTEIRWLSRGRVLSRVLEFRNELSILVMEKKPEWAQLFQETGWLLKLTYLADIFSILNELNVSLQGKNASMFRMYDKILALKKKLRIWEQRILRNCFDMFPTCSSLIYECVQDFYVHNLSTIIVGHLRCLQEQFNASFPDGNDPRSGNEWIRNPFAVINLSRTNLNAVQEDRLIELSNDKGLEALFEGDLTVSEFWMKVRPEYPELSDHAIRLLLLFPSTNLCEEGYLAFATLKTTYRNRLNYQAPLRVALSHIQPRIRKLVSNKQAQKSHGPNK